MRAKEPGTRAKEAKDYAKRRYELYGRAWYQRNKERRIARMKELREQNPTEWRRRNQRSRQRHMERYRIHRLAKTYGVSETRIRELEQQNRCAICGRDGRLDIDHCHASGKIRARLCGNCNRGLGYFKESITNLCNAVCYLETHA